MIKSNLEELLNEFKKFKVQAVLVLDYKKINDRKIFHSSTKLIASYSDIDEAFKSMDQSIMTKINNYACEDCLIVIDCIIENWIVLGVIIKHSINIFEC